MWALGLVVVGGGEGEKRGGRDAGASIAGDTGKGASNPRDTTFTFGGAGTGAKFRGRRGAGPNMRPRGDMMVGR